MAWTKIAGGVVAFILLFSLAEFLLGIMPFKIRSEKTPEDYNLEFKEVGLNTSDGLRLSAWEIPSRKDTDRWIIVGHGYPFDKGNVIPLVKFLHRDYNLLMLDHRSFGDSEGWITTVGKEEVKDVEAAVQHVREEKRENVSIGGMGLSMSASTLIMAQNNSIDAIVADSPYSDMGKVLDQVYRMFPGPLKKPFVWATSVYSRVFLGFWPSEVSPAEAIEDTDTPTLLIHGEKDSQIPVEHSKEIARNAPDETVNTWFVAGAGHGQSFSKNRGKYKEKVRSFFKENMD